MTHVDLSAPEFGAVAWALEGVRGRPMPEEPREPLAPNWRRSREMTWFSLQALGLQAGDFEIAASTRTDESDGILIQLDLISSEGKPSVFRCRIEPEPPHRILTVSVGRPLPGGYAIREATPSDAPALAALETMVPLELNDSTVVISRGSHYWDHMMLMNSNAYVVENGGRIVGAIADAALPLMVDRREWWFAYVHHIRIHPDHKNKGIGQALLAHGAELAMPATENVIWFVAVGNWTLATYPENMQWSIRPQRLLFDVAELADESAGSVGTDKDATRIVSVLNACHVNEELFLPYTEDRLKERMNRIPSVYSWTHLRVLDDAVIGVSSATEHRRRISPDGSVSETCRAPVLDFGFAGEQGWANFEALLRGYCSELVDTEVTHLSLLTSPPSPEYSRLRALSTEPEFYVVVCMTGEPEAAGRQGVYIDQLYF